MTGRGTGPGAPAGGADAGRFRALVAGLNAVVWERDAATLQVRFVSDRIEELLGYAPAEWQADPGLWERILVPEDRDAAVATVAGSVDHGSDDFAVTYRARARDGRTVWLRHLGHITRRADGSAETIHAVLIDVTDQQRREQAAAVLAEAGRVLSEPGTVEQRLAAIAGLASGTLCDRATVWLRGDDGRYVAVAAAPAEFTPRLRALASVAAPPSLEAAHRAGRPFVLPEIDDDLRRAAAGDGAQYSALAELARGSVLTAPLVAGDQVVGLLTMVAASGRIWDDADLALAADLGQRIATMLAAERMAARQRHSQQITVALAAAGTVAAAAAFLATGLRAALGAALVTVCTVGRDGLLHVEHVAGHPDAGAEAFAPMPLTAPLPLTEAVRSGRPVWIPDRGAWERRFPAAGPALLGRTEGAAVLPLAVGDRVLGAVGLTFPTPREFDPSERTFLIALAGQAAVAFERAALADTRREVADTLQHSLLPDRLPSLERLSVTARYLPGQHGTQAGGDWYDVLPLSDGRVALVVGDVVGNGAAAAAVMGQLRSALAMLLLEGHPPGRALDLLDRFAARIEAARVSTVAVLLLDPATGRLTYSRAGHPPPLVLGAAGARALDGGLGPALDVAARSPRPDTETEVRPGETLLLYTDGLVERRDAPLDVGLERLAAVTAGLAGASPAVLVAGVLEGMFDSAGPADDVAVVAARLVPAPLRLEVPAVPAHLHLLRRGLTEWADAAGLEEEFLDDLLLAVGEAVANAVEHAYADGDGSDVVRVTVERDGDVLRVAVSDAGAWRPPPADAGFRGRGLQIIRGLASDVELLPGPRGTTLRFRLPAAPPAGERVRAPAAGMPSHTAARPAAVHVSQAGDRRCVRLSGEFDLAGVQAVRERLLAAVADGPVLLDLGDLDALFSVGMGLVLETLQAAGPGLEVLLPEAGPVRRALDLTGLTPLLTAPH